MPPKKSLPYDEAKDPLLSFLKSFMGPKARLAGVASWRTVLTFAIVMYWSTLTEIYESVKRLPEMAQRIERMERNQSDMVRRIERIENVLISKGLMFFELLPKSNDILHADVGDLTVER